jgi:hypothetical protein
MELKDIMTVLSRAISVGVSALFLYASSLQHDITGSNAVTLVELSLLFALCAIALLIASFIMNWTKWVIDHQTIMLEVLLLPGLAGIIGALGNNRNTKISIGGICLYAMVFVVYLAH